MTQNLNYQLGLLYFVHVLVNVDGNIDESERNAILAIQKEEKISDEVFHEFQEKVAHFSEQEMYSRGIEHLTACTDEERLAAFVHLYKLAEVDSGISNKEVRFLLYGLKVANLSFEDVVLSAGMTGMKG